MDKTYALALKGRSVLVTGAAGFTGSALVERLVGVGACVRAIVRPGTAIDPRLQKLNVRWFEGNVFDEKVVRQAACDVHWIFHIASSFRRGETSEEMHRLVHVAGTQLLAKTASAIPGFQRFVHVSTVGVHGAVGDVPADENSPFAPSDSYQRTKAEAETWLRKYSADARLPFTVLRPCAIYGPGDKRLLKIFKLASWPIAPLPGGPKCSYHLIYIDDMVDALVTSATHPNALNEIFICGNPNPMPMADFIRTAARAQGRHCRILPVPAWPIEAVAALWEDICLKLHVRPLLYRRRVAFFTKNRAFNTAKIREKLGLIPAYSNEQGITLTAQWYLANGWLKKHG